MPFSPVLFLLLPSLPLLPDCFRLHPDFQLLLPLLGAEILRLCSRRRGDGGEGRIQQQLMQQLQVRGGGGGGEHAMTRRVQSRDLTEDDYDVLLQLDSVNGSFLPLLYPPLLLPSPPLLSFPLLSFPLLSSPNCF
eukprot:738211-Hanusia_phi.AAC.2